jgi:DNA-binding response OmpR family regulator
VLVAEDDPVSRKLLLAALDRERLDVVAVSDGEQALELLSSSDPPRMAILDWMMPKLNGVEVCRRIRELRREPYLYIIFLTARVQREDIVKGLEAGADDYLAKPFHVQELRCRVAAGVRLLTLQSELADKVRELEETLAHVKHLEGLLPICMHCKRIRDDGNHWQPLETYIERRSDAVFSHALCMECAEKHYPQLAHKLTKV